MNRVFEQLEAGATAVTSTRRLSRYLLEEYALRALGQGKSAWATPTVLTWDEWALQQWQRVTQGGNGATSKRPLDDQQELQLWEKVISECVDAGSDYTLVQSAATALAAKETWKLIHDWQIPLSLLKDTLIEDTQVYYSWANEFIKQKDSNGWMTICEINAALQRQLPGQKWLSRVRLRFVGFDALLPAQQGLVNQLSRTGVDLEQIPLPQVSGRTTVVPCQDRLQEFESSAHWARQLLLDDEKGTIAVIVDDLARWRDKVDSVFDQVLHGAESLSYDSERTGTFHVSLGKPLSEYPIVKSALGMLDLMKPSIPARDVSRLLHSPFLGGGFDEFSLRAGIDLELRKRGWEEVSLRGLAGQAQAAGAARLGDRLHRAADFQLPHTASPSTWGGIFITWLSMFGWPGERMLNSEEYQAVRAWRELISRFARLNVVTPESGLDRAITQLNQMANRRIFQPRGGAARVQIMGVLEAAGMQFSHLWITGMSDDKWPPPPRSNPFLPYGIQRDFGLPGVLAESELTRYGKITLRLLGSADRAVISFPRQREDQTLHLSPLYQGLTEHSGPVQTTSLAGYLHQHAPRLEILHDDTGPVLDDADLHGGASIFKDQSACAFRAFARHRLRANGVVEVEPGLNPMQRGNLVHLCLADVWGEIRTQANLMALSEHDLNKILERHIDRAVSSLAARDSSPFRRRILDIERIRLFSLLCEWMVVERARPAFRVTHIEQKIDGSLCGIDLRLRIDRIDEMDNGQRAIIDYKTGTNVRIEHWLDERPEEPQLPLYMLAYDDEVGALAFAHLRKGDSSFKGLSESESFAAGVGVRGDWPDLKSGWRGVLTDLAEQFKAGAAVLNPKNKTVCANCDVRPFCRVFDSARGPQGGVGD